MIELADAANDLAALLESTARGLKHPRHSQHVAPARQRIKAVIVHYFERQRRAVMSAVKPKISRELLLYPPIREASQSGKTFAKQLLPATLNPLTFAATRGEDTEYTDAVTELIAAASQSLEATASGASFAEQYLRDNSLSKLTGSLNKTSIERLQDALANAWDAGGDYNSMVKAITDTFDNFSTKRADLIAQTESADAYNAGRQSTALAIGMDEHSWETESDDPCPVCLANEAQGWIDIGDNFDSGDDAPTAHTKCLCVVNFRKAG